jgi:hypothetical protein
VYFLASLIFREIFETTHLSNQELHISFGN